MACCRAGESSIVRRPAFDVRVGSALIEELGADVEARIQCLCGGERGSVRLRLESAAVLVPLPDLEQRAAEEPENGEHYGGDDEEAARFLAQGSYTHPYAKHEVVPNVPFAVVSCSMRIVADAVILPMLLPMIGTQLAGVEA